MTIDLDLMPPAQPPAPSAPRARRAAVAGGLVLALAALAVVAIALRPDGPPAPTPPPPPPTNGQLGWVEKLVDGPPRGALAADAAFVEDLLGEVTRILHDSSWRPVTLWGVDDRPHDDLQPSLLFADDIEDRRVVLLALRLPAAPDPDSGMGRTSVTWLSGPQDATVGLLTSALRRRPLPEALAGRTLAAPMTIIEAGPQLWPDSGVCDAAAGCVWVGLAPDGCTVATSPAADGRTWTPEPTDSYIVRTTTTRRPEYWRVTCDGVVHEMRPAPKPPIVDVPDELVAPAAADLARIVGDDTYDLLVQGSASSLLSSGDFELAQAPRVLWASERDDLPDVAGDGGPVSGLAVLLASPSGRLTWCVGADFYFTHDGVVYGGGMSVIEVASDPNLPGTVIASQISWEKPTFLVIARSATSVRLVDPDGETILEAPVVNDAAVITAPAKATMVIDPVYGSRRAHAGLRVVALDARGDTVGSTDFPTQTTIHHYISTWD